MHNLISFSGGAIYAVGIATSLKVLADNGLPISKMPAMAYGGNSAGAIVASLLALGYDEKEIYDAVLSSVNDAMVKWHWTKRLLKPSVLDHHAYEEKLKHYFSAYRMNDTKVPLYLTAVPTNTMSNWKVFDKYDDTEIWQAVRASSSAPPYFKPITIEGTEYIDGGFGRNNPSEVLLNAVHEQFNVRAEDVRVLNWRTTGISKGKKLGAVGYLGAGKYLVENFISIGEDCTDFSMKARLGTINSNKPNRYFSFCPIDTANAGFFEKDKISKICKMWERYTLHNLGKFENWLFHTN